jgi:acetylornithine deacetylase/succinyl-diaminopimelate desuccinylase-like protein
MTPLEHARGQRDAALARLVELLRIPSISTQPELAGEVRRAAEWVAQRMRSAGLTGVRVDDTPGHPVVYGEWNGAPHAPTVLVYGHYDVQPVDPLDLWDSPPFEPTLRDGYLYARGSSDDKGQALVHLEAADAWLSATGKLPVNLKVFIEGEEEVGSPNLDDWVRAHAGELVADVALISDTAIVAPDQPSITYGLRGLTYMELEVTGPNRDLHSGQYGGAVRNPANALCQIIAQLHDADGRVTIPGFYDRVRPIPDEERAALAAVPFDLGAFHDATGAAGGHGEAGYSLAERLGARPTLDVNGLLSGWTGPGAKTVLPAKAMAKVSMRLVPDQDPEHIAQLFTHHVQSIAPEGVQVEVRSLHGGWPAVVDRDLPAMRAAADAYEAAFGRAPVYTREGGTIPVVALLEQELGVPSVLMGFGLPDDNLHAPNERFRVENFHRGIEAAIIFLEAFAEREPSS